MRFLPVENLVVKFIYLIPLKLDLKALKELDLLREIPLGETPCLIKDKVLLLPTDPMFLEDGHTVQMMTMTR